MNFRCVFVGEGGGNYSTDSLVSTTTFFITKSFKVYDNSVQMFQSASCANDGVITDDCGVKLEENVFGDWTIDLANYEYSIRVWYPNNIIVEAEQTLLYRIKDSNNRFMSNNNLILFTLQIYKEEGSLKLASFSSRIFVCPLKETSKTIHSAHVSGPIAYM